MTTEAQHEKQMNDDSDRDSAIELLAAQLSCASSLAVSQVLIASNYEFSHKIKNNLTNGSDEFNGMFCEIAEKLIDSVG